MITDLLQTLPGLPGWDLSGRQAGSPTSKKRQMYMRNPLPVSPRTPLYERSRVLIIHCGESRPSTAQGGGASGGLSAGVFTGVAPSGAAAPSGNTLVTTQRSIGQCAAVCDGSAAAARAPRVSPAAHFILRAGVRKREYRG